MKQEITIHIGMLYASTEPTIIYTLLGSCVAVCLYDPVSRVGGMNHILLPGSADMRHFNSSARYGINAMELLINRIMAIGGNRKRLVAKAFGGAHVLPSISLENGVGRKNSEFILEFLEVERINLVSHDLGGYEARKIYFHTDTGEVLLKRIPTSHSSSVAIEERKVFSRVLKETEKPGGITLFTDEPAKGSSKKEKPGR